MTPRVRQLLRRAKNVEEMGKQFAAEKLFRELMVEAPDEPDVLLSVARVTRDQAEQTALLERVLEIEPKNPQAWAGLAGDWLPPEPKPASSEEEEEESSELAAPVAIAPVHKSVVEIPDIHAHDGHEHMAAGNNEEDDDDDEVVGLTCNKCGKAIDINTSIHTPVGYRCKACVRELEDTKYYTSRSFDYIIAILVALPVSMLAGYFVPWVGFFVFFLAAGTGTFIGTLTLRAIGKRRGRYIPAVVAVCVAIGGLAPMLVGLLLALIFGGFDGFSFLRYINFWSAIYTFIATGSAYYRLR